MDKLITKKDGFLKSNFYEKVKNNIIYILLMMPAMLFAQLSGRVTDKNGDGIPGVNVLWLNTTIGTATDTNGRFEITRSTESDYLVFSNVAYNKDTMFVAANVEKINVTLSEIIALKELSVVSRNMGLVKPRTTVLKTEVINAEELHKAACCNLSESFETNPSIDVAYSDAATGAEQIKMLGLAGSYVQMLTENVPNMRGLSSAYGLGYVPGPWMESIQVSKGTASVINGYEAITGQINVEYKKPRTSEKVFANLFASNSGRVEANVNASAILTDKLSTAVLLHASDEFLNVDDNNDKFMDMPMVKQYNIVNRWDYKTDDYTFHFFMRALDEERKGGQIVGDYHIGIETQRAEFFMKNGYVFDKVRGTSLGWITSGSWHNHDAKYGHKGYDSNQKSLYSNLIFQTSFGKAHKLSTGLSVNYDVYDEKLLLHNSMDTNYPELVTGAFAEYTLNINDKFIALAGLRADANSRFGTFVTPRLNLKYNVSEHLHLRASAGKGYRSPHIMAENNYLLASSREIVLPQTINMEEAWNYGLSAQSYVHIFDREISLSAEWFYTNFSEQIVADMDRDVHKVYFDNLAGKSYANSLQFEISAEPIKGFTVLLAHRLNDVKTTTNGILQEKVLTNRYKSLITTSYQTPLRKWQFDFTTQFDGGGRMPDPDALQPLWHKTFDAFTVFNAQITRYFRTWSVYLGGENLSNFKQHNPIVDVQNPFGSNFDATMIWGPVYGRKFYVGMRWAIDRDRK